MTDQTKPAPSAIEQALGAAGAEFVAALSDAGLRFVATSALGQVIAGLPDAARGMVKAMPLNQRYKLIDAAMTLHEITAAEVPETTAADQHQADAPQDVADSLRIGSVFATAYRAAHEPGSPATAAYLRRQVNDTLTDDELRRTREACILLRRLVESIMPQDGSQ
jgi:hypothetical protein